MKEIVSNIIRHAAASQIAITIDLTEKNWKFTLTDSGKGFDQYGSVGNGLANMQSRAAEIDASLSIESEFESGTCISSAFPASTSKKILS